MRTKEEVQSFLMKRRNEMRLKPTPSEARLKLALESAGIRHVFQSIKFANGTYRIFDFYIPKKRVVVEVDGPYHDPVRDRWRDRHVLGSNPKYTILRFTNRQIDEDLDVVMKTIQNQ